MKKLFTLIAFIGFAFGAHAQRMCDLQITMVNPVTGTNFKSGDTTHMKIVVKNLGTAQFKTTDSIIFAYTLGGGYLHFGGGGNDSIFAMPCPKNLNTGDTLQINRDLTITYSGVHSPTVNSQLCFLTNVLNRSADSVKDPVLTNNNGCDTNTYLDVHTYTGNHNEVSVYPNPAQANATFNVSLTTASNVSVRLVDMMGRVVLSEDKGKLNSGNNKFGINASTLSNGLYIYQVIVGNETITGRFSIAK